MTGAEYIIARNIIQYDNERERARRPYRSENRRIKLVCVLVVMFLAGISDVSKKTLELKPSNLSVHEQVQERELANWTELVP